jgi:hypothetical protein
VTSSLELAGRHPSVTASFSSADRRYEPLEEIRVRYTVELPPTAVVRTVERSILWYTEGKGEEDIGVHFFERVTERAAVVDGAAGGTFGARLPSSPLSYEGVIVKIRWCARVRLFFEEGRDFVSEHVFELGHVPVATIVPS